MPSSIINTSLNIITLKVKITPNSSCNKITGMLADNTIKIRIKALPVKHKANEELVSFLAKYLNITKSNIIISKGREKPKKTIVLKNIMPFKISLNEQIIYSKKIE
jgi:uncharacterized protein (TIGR00251 family)